MIAGPLLKSFIESDDIPLFESEKTRQMITNWPAAAIILMDISESTEIGVGGNTYTTEWKQQDMISRPKWTGNSSRWRLSQFERVTSGHGVY